jgi:hypothetical protein
MAYTENVHVPGVTQEQYESVAKGLISKKACRRDVYCMSGLLMGVENN